MTEIRSNQQLENDLSLMDIKIGLLVRNRITLQVLNGSVTNQEISDSSLDVGPAFHAWYYHLQKRLLNSGCFFLCL